MEGLILEVAQVYGLPFGIASAVIYYMLKRGPTTSPKDGLDDLRKLVQSSHEVSKRNERALQEIRDMLIVLKDRSDR